MKFVIILVFVTMAGAFPAPEASDNGAYVSTSYVAADHSKAENRDSFGQYGLSYLTKNGIEITEKGYLKPASDGQYYLVKEGTYKYKNLDGSLVNYKYTADENGFVVQNL